MLLYVGTTFDLKFAHLLKQLGSQKGYDIKYVNKQLKLVTDISKRCEAVTKEYKVSFDAILCSDPGILKKVLSRTTGQEFKSDEKVSISNYAGVIVPFPGLDIPIMFIPSPQSIVWGAKQRWTILRYIDKLYSRCGMMIPKLDWTAVDLTNMDAVESELQALSPYMKLMSIDIETHQEELPVSVTKNPASHGLVYLDYARDKKGNKKKNKYSAWLPKMDICGFTVIYQLPDGNLYSKTYVYSTNTLSAIESLKRIFDLPVAKTLQNGLYDMAWLARYGIAPANWAWDTLGLMHSWMIELPRDLGFIASIFIQNHMYWKDEITGDRLEYNAKDCHITAWLTLIMVNELPQWAIDNYVETFRQVFPCHCCNLEGFLEDKSESLRLWEDYNKQIAEEREWWSTVVTQDFNPNSPKQVQALFKGLGVPIKSTEAKEIEKIKYANPLITLIVEKLEYFREIVKAESTYMNVSVFGGRYLYALNPFGTDSWRFASKASHFWCGLQIQNVPAYAKSKFIADEGWELSSRDYSQSESRTTAYTTLDANLIDAVENAKDFHVRNACLFFGIPEEEIFAWKKNNYELYDKIRNKIGKRLNHGANYNMMEYVLISTMTPRIILETKTVLGLPTSWSMFKVANFLLHCFDQAYPLVRSKEPGGYHYNIIEEVEATSMLRTPDKRTRYTFLRPGEKKMDLNSLVAFIPQSWSVTILNKSFFDGWYRLQIKEKVWRVKAQIHDEIIGQSRPEHTAYCQQVLGELMSRPNKIRPDKEETFIIPSETKPPALSWDKIK